MKKQTILFIIFLLSIMTLPIAIGIGTVFIKGSDVIYIIISEILNIKNNENISEVTRAIVMNIRFPRVILAYVSGAGLAVSGVLMQSVLRNPLASSLTLGVSAGASLGASVVFLLNISIFGFLTLPIFGMASGLATVFLALLVATKVDKNFNNNSIILMGTAFSLFANAILTVIMSVARESLESLVSWQMGSFAMRDIRYLFFLAPFVLVGILIALYNSYAIDVLTLGDEQGITTGLNVKKLKILLLSLSGIVTGSIISVVGIIGFVDLFTPHVARKILGANHKYIIPASAFLGGAFMVICDLIARVIVPPLEIPVGSVTAIIGAPFFMYLYFSKRK
ncbi:MAG: FecCD family ABC transporter permease [Lachnospirales bacterium]